MLLNLEGKSKWVQIIQLQLKPRFADNQYLVCGYYIQISHAKGTSPSWLASELSKVMPIYKYLHFIQDFLLTFEVKQQNLVQ